MQSNPVLTSLAQFWWLRIPTSAFRFSRALAVQLVDGLYLTSIPILPALAHLVVLIAGLIIGWLQPGYRTVFSESLGVLLIMVSIGVLSSALGSMFLLGFALGDFFLSPPHWPGRFDFMEILIQGRVPQIIEYGILGLLLVSIAITTKSLAAQIRPPTSWGRTVGIVVAFASHLLFTLLLVFFWMQIVPILIRPLFTWLNQSPPRSAMVILQEDYTPLLIAAAIASIMRMVIQALTASRSPFRERLDLFEQGLQQPRSAPELVSRIPKVIRLIFMAFWSTLLLSGMFESWIDGALLGGLTLVLLLLRDGVIRLPLGAYPRLIGRIPALFRLVIGAVVVFFLSQLILQQNSVISSQSFRPILIITALAMFVFFLLNPTHESEAQHG